MSIFVGHECASMLLILFENTENVLVIDGECCSQCSLFIVHCSGTMFPKSTFSLCILRRSPSGPSAIRLIEMLPCQMSRWVPLGWSRWGATKHQHRNFEYAKWHDIYTPEECADEWMQNNADFNWLCHEWFHHVPTLDNSPHITMTSSWERWRLKSPASRLFTQPFIQTQIKENIKAPRHWPLCGEFTGTGEFPAQRASYAENPASDNSLH